MIYHNVHGVPAPGVILVKSMFFKPKMIVSGFGSGSERIQELPGPTGSGSTRKGLGAGGGDVSYLLTFPNVWDVVPGLEDAVLLLEGWDPGVGDHAQLQVRQPTRGLNHRRLSLLAVLLKRVTVTDNIAE